MGKQHTMSRVDRAYQLIDDIDSLIFEKVIDPINLVLDIMENHLLEDGVKGNSEYQDLLGDAWKSLRAARKLKMKEE